MTKVALLGFGVVGQGTAALLTENRDALEKRLGEAPEVGYILDIRDFPDSPFADKIVHDIRPILDDPDVRVVAEMIGGKHPAFDFCMAALDAGKSVVTSNKEMVATFGDQLLRKAEEKGVFFLFEASVGGGIPVLRPVMTDLAGNRISEISGILNGTTNYILTRMAKEGSTFDDALKEAQKKGYAEQNPAADVEGIDACRKIVILGALASGKLIPVDSVPVTGITAVRREDVALLSSVGAAVKLVGRYVATRSGDLFMTVSPFVIPKEAPLASVDGVFNAVLVNGNYVGEVMFYGMGAGSAPTASAVVGDIFNILAGSAPRISPFVPASESDLTPFDDFIAPRFLSVEGADTAAVRVIFGDETVFLSENGTVSFLTPPISGHELAEATSRLSACNATVLSTIPVFA